MKICTKCNSIKNVDCFSKDKRNKNGLQSWCIECIKEKRAEYYKTKIGLAALIYSNQKRSSKQRKHNAPTYNKEWLKAWLFNQELFHKLYDKWVENNYNINITPSVDRKNDYLGYTETNIQLMTWSENRNKGHLDRTMGNNNKQNKTILQFTKDLIFIKEYHSINEANRQTNVSIGNISQCCNGLRNSAGGFIWKNKESQLHMPDIF